MELTFTWRKPTAKDLEECLNLHPAKAGSEIVGRAAAIQAWKRMLEMKHACRSAVIEARSLAMKCGRSGTHVVSAVVLMIGTLLSLQLALGQSAQQLSGNCVWRNKNKC